jgi:hypothetical protein
LLNVNPDPEKDEAVFVTGPYTETMIWYCPGGNDPKLMELLDGVTPGKADCVVAFPKLASPDVGTN